MRITRSKRTSVTASEYLDDRFSFDLDNEFEIYLDTRAKSIPCYVVESEVIGGGAGTRYTVAVAVPREDTHWQITEDIERNLNRYVNEQVDGSDYTGWIEDSDASSNVTYDIADPVLDDSEVYMYDICIAPYQNISPYGELGIDAGVIE